MNEKISRLRYTENMNKKAKFIIVITYEYTLESIIWTLVNTKWFLEFIVIRFFDIDSNPSAFKTTPLTVHSIGLSLYRLLKY